MEPFKKHIYGDKCKKLEPEHHEFIFPGGTINIQRCGDGDYWVHFYINQVEGVGGLLTSKACGIIDSRCTFIDYSLRKQETNEIPNAKNLQHIALRVCTRNPAF